MSISASLETRIKSENETSLPYTMTDREYWRCLGVFLVTGTATLYYWNSVLNTLYSVVGVRFPDHPYLADTVTAGYSTFAFLTAITMSFVGPLRRRCNLYGGLTLALMTILFPVATLKLSGNAGAIVLHLTAIIAGVAETAFQVSGFAYAVILPYNYGGWVSFGYGICGVLTFSIWMLLSQGIFDINSGSDSQIAAALWCHMAVAGLITLIAVLAFHYFSKSSLAERAIRRAKQRQEEELDVEKACSDLKNDEDTPKKNVDMYKTSARQYLKVFSRTWLMQCGLAFTIGLSMMAYPLIGPYRWNRTYKENDILTGIFQVGDFVGRYVPNLSRLVPCFLLPSWLVLPLTLARLILLGLFIWIAKSTEGGNNGIAQKFNVQVCLMLALSLSHGWYATVYMSRIPDGVSHPKDKARASSMAVSLLVCAIAVGLWLAKSI